MKKALVIRPGAFGDVLIVSPVFSALKRLGYKVYVYVGARGETICRNNPNIDEIILYKKEGSYNPDILKDFDDVKKSVGADWCKDFSESIEVNVALHASSPAYIYPKKERAVRGGKNYYDVTERWAEIPLSRNGRILPEFFLTNQEIIEAKKYLKDGHINILWALSGSGANKVYPWTDYVMGELIKNYSNINFITVGDVKCKILELAADDIIKSHCTNLSGEIDFRISMALTQVVDLVIAPDTGILHAAGASYVHKIGILGHTTTNNITKYFFNDYSLNSDEKKCECSPCYRLIYDHKVQCPIDNLTGAAWCMAHGQPIIRLYDKIVEALLHNGNIRERKEAGRSPSQIVPNLQSSDV